MPSQVAVDLEAARVHARRNEQQRPPAVVERRSPTSGEIEAVIDTLARMNPEVNVHHLSPGMELRLTQPNVSFNMM